MVAGVQDYVASVSCGSAGNCAIGGNYSAPHGLVFGFMAAERNGHWGAAITMPRGAANGIGGTRVFPVSCVAAGPCTAGGRYVGAAGQTQGFIVTHTG